MELFDDKVRRGKKSRSQNLTLKIGSDSKDKSHNELIFKVVSNIKGNNVSGSVDYITRNKPDNELEEFIEPFNEMNETLERHELEKLKEEWKEEFSDPKKIKSRNMTHLVLSIDVEPTEKNKKNFDSAAREFLSKRFGEEGFRYIAVQHNDTDKPHVHILLNNNNLETGKKHRIDIAWHYETRLMAKRILKEHGIEQKATFKKDRQFEQAKLKEQIHDHEKDYSDVKSWFDSKLKTSAKNDEHFKQLKRQIDVIDALKSGLSETTTVNNGATLLEHGEAPYQFNKENKKSYYVALDNGATIWGVGLQSAIEKSGVKIGDRVDIQKTGTEKVKIQDKDGITKEVKRVGWSVTESEDIQLKKNTVIKAKDDRFSTQQQVKATQLLKELKADLRTYDNYQTRTGANQALRDVIKTVDPEKSLIKTAVNKALNKEHQRNERSSKKEQRKNYFLAKELVRGREIVKSSPDITKREKRDILATIDKQAERFTSQGIDIKKLEREYLSQLSDNKQYVTAMKSLNGVERSIDKQIKKDGQLSQSDTQKRMVRLLDATHSANTSNLTKDEKTRLEKSKEEVFKSLSERGINTSDIEKKWKEARLFKDQVAEVKSRLTSTNFESNLTDQTQKEILSLSNQLKTAPPEFLSKKERYSSNVSLQRSQETLNTITKNDFSRVDKATSSMLKNLATLDQKLANDDKQKAKQQAFAITKSAIKLERESPSLNVTSSQGRHINHRLSTVLNEINQRGFDVESVKSKLELTEKITSKVNEIKGLSMTRIRVKGFDKVQSEIEKVKKEVPNIDMRRDDKRQINRDMNAKNKEIEQTRAVDVASLEKNLKEIKSLVGKIERLNEPDYKKSLSNLEKLNNKREIESCGKQIGKLIDSSKSLVSSASSRELQQAYRSELHQAAKYVQEPSKGFER